jgi:hypothetical protein
MTIFDYIVDQLLEIIRLAIYSYAKRPAPARKSRKEAVAARAAAAPVEKQRARRRRSSPWNSPLTWLLIIGLGLFIYRRLARRA